MDLDWFDPEQTPVFVMDDDHWCEAYIADVCGSEVAVVYTDRHGVLVEDWIPDTDVYITKPPEGEEQGP